MTALAFALLARHAARARMPLLIGGLGRHAGLALIETVGASGGSDGGFLAACAVLAATHVAAGRPQPLTTLPASTGSATPVT